MQLRPEIKGWCPGAHAPMQSGDGLLIRAKAIGSHISAAQAREIARIAESCGNGLIDLSQRAQWQLRGVNEATLFEAQRRLDAIGLLAPDADAERVANIIASPLSGLDATAAFDANEMAARFATTLRSDPRLRALPAKFLFLVDDGGALSLTGAEADIRIEATKDGRVAIRLAGAPDLAAFVEQEEAMASALRLARAFIELRAAHAYVFRRVGALVETLGAEAMPRLAGLSFDRRADARPPAPPAQIYGAQQKGGVAYAGVAAPFGRWRARELAAIAELAVDEGMNELRLTPWRALLIPTPDEEAARRIVARSERLDFITSAEDERLAVVACPGAPECEQAQGETRAYAARLAPLARRLGGAEGVSLHLSGCAKGCAHPGVAPITLVVSENGFNLIENGAADHAPRASALSFDAVLHELAARAAERTS